MGYFTKREIEGIRKVMQGRTYMKFDVGAGNYAGNCTLIVRTDYEASEEDVKGQFLNCALAELARMKRTKKFVFEAYCERHKTVEIEAESEAKAYDQMLEQIYDVDMDDAEETEDRRCELLREVR